MARVNHLSKLFTSGEAFTAWVQPEIGEESPPHRQAHKQEAPVDHEKELARQAAEIKESARREGFKQGLSEAHAQARQEIDNVTDRLMALIDALATPLEQLSDEVEDELVKLAVAIAKQIVRRELKTDPTQVIGVVKEALNALPAAGQNIKLHLHPEDAKLVADTMLANANERKWELVDNPLIQRGGCRIETDSSNVDATIESRVAAIAARIMGGERANDS